MRSRTWVGDLALRTHPLNGSVLRKVFAMLIAYMDDSGTHEGAHNCLFAGYWGGVKEWSRFEYLWKQIIDSEGVSEFHAKEFWFRFKDGTRIEPYKTWTEERHRSFINRLLLVIEQCNVTPFAFGVSTADWASVPQNYRDVWGGKEFFRNREPHPAVLAFGMCATRLFSYCKEGKVMHFVCDTGCHSHPLLLAYQDLKKFADSERCYPQFGSLTFEDGKKAVALQAADLLAYEAHRYAKKAGANRDAPMRDEYRRALTRARSKDDFWLFDEPRLRNFQNAVDKVVEEVQKNAQSVIGV